MTSLRHLTKKEVEFIVKDVKNQKLEVKRILQTKVKVYKLSSVELKKIKTSILNLTSSKDIPRYLNDEELDYIVDVIPESPCCVSDIAKFNREKIIKKIRNQISTFKICPLEKSIEKFRERVYENFVRSLCKAGESVGSNGANSIGQLLTQLNLNTFHSAGRADSSNDLKTIEELFNISVERSKNSCTVHFKEKNLTKEEIFKSYNQKLKGITIKDLINYSEILTNPSKEDLVWYNNYETITNQKINKSPKFLRLYLHVYRCYLYDISIDDIIYIINKTTKISGNKNSLYCIPTSTFEGIIDIHADEEFIRKTVETFSTSGKSFKGCGKKYFQTSKNFNDEEENFQRTFIKTPITSSSLKDLTTIFLSEILESCFKEMIVIGVKGLENTSTITLNMVTFTKSVKIKNDKDLVKFTSSKYNLKPEDCNRLFYIYIDYNTLNITGIPGQKFVNFFSSVGMKVIEKNLECDNPNCVVLLPEVSDELFEGSPRFKKVKEIIYDIKDKKNVYTLEDPLKLMNRKLKESENKLKESVSNLLESEDYSNDFLSFPEIYKNGYYNYIKAYGKGIFNQLMKNKLVDSKYSMSDNVNDINKYFGIESSRLYLIKEYTANDNIKKMNHVNIDLLVDFQTTMGHLLSVTSTDISKHSTSALSSAAFEQPMVAFQKAGSTGSKDYIDNISSCLMAGKECKNGTGKVEVIYDDEYLQDNTNKVQNVEVNEITFQDVKQGEMLGNCFAAGKYIEEDFKEESDEEPQLQFGRNKINKITSSKAKNILNKSSEEKEQDIES